MQLVDTHCHLTWESFDNDRADVLARAAQAGVTRMVTIGTDIASSRACVELASAVDNVFAAVGVHPNDVGDGLTSTELEELRALANHPKVVAIGEIGLDYYWERVPHALQQAAFEAQLALAVDIGKPVVIHNREAHADVLRTLDAWVKSVHITHPPLEKRRWWGVMHSFSGNLEQANFVLQWPFLLSFAGPITFKNARELHTLLRLLPLDRLMIETDAPFLTPHPFRGQRNEPARVALVAEQAARLFDVPVEKVADCTTRAATEFFGFTQS